MQLQLILQYDAVSLAAKGMYEPSDKFASPIVEYTFSSPVKAGNLKWLSEDALLDDIAVYALDHTYKAAAVSYEQDPNDTDIWVSKLTENKGKVNSEKDQQTPILFIIIYAVIAFVILSLGIVIIIVSSHIICHIFDTVPNIIDSISDCITHVVQYTIVRIIIFIFITIIIII